MVPSGWDIKYISELCESIIDCVNKTAPHVDYETPYKMIRTTNVRNGKVDTENVRYVEKDVYETWIRRGAPKEGDIIFTREAPVGEVGILENAEGIFLGQRTMMYRVDPKVADNRFIFYSLSSSYGQKQFLDLSNGGTVHHMRVPDCGKIRIQTPPLPEQQKIAKILTTWDKAINATESLIENSKQQKKALMQQLLTGKKRLLDDSGQRFSGDWEEKRANDLAVRITKGTTPTSSGFKYHEVGINFVKVESITRSGDFILSKFAYIDEDCHQSFKRSQLEENDILFSIAGALGRVAIVKKEILPANTNQALAIIRLNHKLIDYSFLFYYLQSPLVATKILALTAQAAQPNLSLKDVGSLPILKPSLEEQQKIAAVLTNTDREIEVLEQQLADLQQEKKALMQQLLTGKKRVLVD